MFSIFQLNVKRRNYYLDIVYLECEVLILTKNQNMYVKNLTFDT